MSDELLAFVVIFVAGGVSGASLLHLVNLFSALDKESDCESACAGDCAQGRICNCAPVLYDLGKVFSADEPEAKAWGGGVNKGEPK